MKNKELKDRLAKVTELCCSGYALDRDLALEILREVYAAIKFGETEVQAELPATVIGIAEPGPEPESMPESAPESMSEPLIDETELEGEDCQTVITETVKEEVVVPEESPETKEAPQPQITPRSVAPEVIRSLYGTEHEEKSKETKEATIAAEAGATTTLGDAMAKGRQTLGETIRTTERPGLRRSIGLNDRFLMIRDIFGGDATAFDEAISRLDTFTDLDEAIIFIHDNYHWSADNQGAARLVDLLERKLG